MNHILTMCSEQGVELSLDGDTLAVFFDDTPSDELIALLKANKPQLIDYLQSHQAAEGAQQAIPVLQKDVAPLTYGQKRLWFIDQLENGSAQYNLPMALALDGEVDIAALQSALNVVLERHEILRTVYEIGGARQRVTSVSHLPLDLTDLSSVPNQSEALAAHARQVLSADFDLHQDVMVRASLVKLAESQHQLFLAVHHIACDGWSLSVMVDELCQAYAAVKQQREPDLSALPIQFNDYAYWLDEQTEHVSQGLDYWVAQLAGVPPLHSLPTLSPRPEYQSFRGQKHLTHINADLHAQAVALARSHDVTPFMLYYSVFSVLVAYWSSESDVVIGTPIANRNRTELEPIIGNIANTLVLRSAVNKQHAFTDLLAQTKARVLEAFNHQEVPFEMVVERLQPERSLSYSPLFQILFSFHTQAAKSIALPGLTLTPVSDIDAGAKFDLELSISDTDTAPVLSWIYASDVFAAPVIERMALCYTQILTQVIADASLKIAALTAVPAADKTLLQTISSTPAPSEAPLPLCAIAQHSKHKPEKQALIFEQQTITYAELDRQATQLANCLLGNGAQAGDIIGINIERSIEMVVAMLGTFKAGCAYLPLEPGYPQARLDMMIADSGTQQVLTKADVAEQKLNDYAASDAGLALVTASQLAYLIYTSGSTGKPKGVMVSHGNMANFIAGMAAHIGSEAIWLAVTGIAFDISVLEIFGTLASGGTVVIAPDQSQAANLQTPEHNSQDLSLGQRIVQHQVTHIQCTPSFAKGYLQHSSADELSSLRKIFIGGERFPPDLAQTLLANTQAEIHNMYGPTEATVWSSCHQLQASENEIGIGKPLPGYTLYVLDEQYQPLPLGVTGQLFIAGQGLAQGYFNNVVLTNEKFVRCPFAQHDVMYATGDIARWAADGTLQYVGRNDRQVKLRGYRIELDEIEHHLLTHPDIDMAAVIVERKGQGDERLVAFIQPTASENKAAQTNQLREFLSDLVPHYMVPQWFIPLADMPLTLNGKIDRNKLPAVDLVVDSQDIIKPENDIEARLLEIWSELLAIDAEKISTRANFFELGGHSLLLTRLFNEIKTRFSVELSIRQLFENPQISALAPLIAEQVEATQSTRRFTDATDTRADQTENLVL